MGMIELLYSVMSMLWVLMIPLALIALVILSMRAGCRTKRAGNKLICLIGAAIPVAMAGLIWFVLILLTSVAYVQETIIACGALGMLVLWMGLKIFGGWKRRGVRRGYLAGCLCLLLGAGGFYGWYAYDQSVMRMDEGQLILYDYRPYGKDTKCAVLEEEADFTLTEPLRLDGATALYPVYASLARATYPEEALIDSSPYDDEGIVRCTTTAEAYSALIRGEVDLIFVAGASDAQAEYAKSHGEEMIFTPIGQDAFVFFVNGKNPVKGLSVEQIQGIYSGEITDWRDVGGKAGSIRAFQREEGSGSQTQLVRFMGDAPLMEAPEENVIDGMGGIIRKTADYKNYINAIGYSFRFYAGEMMKDDQIHLLAVNGIEPNTENIAGGSYPLSGAFYAVRLASNEKPDIDAFIEWVLGSQGQALIEKTGYVPLSGK